MKNEYAGYYGRSWRCSLFFLLIAVFCIGLPGTAVQGQVLLEEHWDAKVIDSDTWNFAGYVEVVEAGPNDYAIRIKDSDIHHWDSTVMSRTAFARGGNLRVTYKLWGEGFEPGKGKDGLVNRYGGCLYGPWHSAAYDLLPKNCTS